MYDSGSGAGEYELKEGDFLISRTDLSGKITYANPAFIEVSGFSWDELNGADHNIVRHPGMPKAAFGNLWQTLKKQKAWNGLVMNRRKDGGHYWVRAHVTPYYEAGKHVGYASVRTRAERSEIAFANEVYKKLSAGSGAGYFLCDGEIREKGVLGLLRRLSFSSVAFNVGLMVSISLGMAALSYWMGYQARGRLSESDALALMLAELAFMPACVAALGFAGWRVFRSVVGSITAAMDFSSQIAAGNLGVKIPDVKGREMRRLARLLDIMRKSLASIVVDVGRSVGSVSAESARIAQNNDELAVRTDDQAASLQQTAVSMDEITATVERNSHNSQQASQLADSASNSVRKSSDVMHHMVSKMTTISEASRKMSEIVGMIDSIAFQTNILALNASVEAARAGENGRGFAVVATEVRNLASRSAEAAKEIRALIDKSVADIADGASLVLEAERSIDEVIDVVTKVNTIISDISAASVEQGSEIAQINQSVAQLDSVTQKNAGMVQRAKQISTSLNGQVSDLVQAISVFRIDGRRERGNSGREHAHGSPRTAAVRERARQS